MIKSFIQRHRLLLLPLSVVMGITALSWAPLAAQTPTVSSLASVVITEATAAPRGVLVKWLAAQSTHRVARYIVERDSGDGNFVQIAQVDDPALTYLDGEGKPGDGYRILAEDTQRPATQSKASEVAVAVFARPGSNIEVSLAKLSNASGSLSTDEFGILIKEADTAVSQGREGDIEASLLALYNYQTRILSYTSQLSITEKKAFGQLCRDSKGVFDAGFYLLPERYQMDGSQIIAACNAIQDMAE